jgi:ACS family glucarate transporter-like MFS transporter
VSTPSSRPTYVRHYVLAALLVITAINYVQRNCIGPAATTIQESLDVSGVALDLAIGAFFYTYTFFQIPSGWLAQRVGPRLILPLYATGWSLALALCAAATGFWGLYLARLAIGAFQAGIFPCATLILAVWYPTALRGTATALLNSFMLLGGAAGSAAVGYLLNPVGFPYLLNQPLSWQTIFLLYAAPGVLWAAWFLWWFRDRPADHPSVNNAERDLLPREEPPAPTAPSRASWLVVLTVPVVLLCTQQCFRAAAPRLFESRLPTYLEKERGQDKKTAAILSTWPQWFGVVGGLVGGMLSDYLLRRTRSRFVGRNLVAIGSLVVCLGWYAAAWFATDVYVAVFLLATGSFFFNFSSPCAYALVIDIGSKHLPIAFGAMNMVGNLGAAVFTSTIMLMVNAGGWPLAFGVWVLLHVIAIVCWLLLDPSRTIGEES